MPPAVRSPPGRLAPPPPLSAHETQWLIKHARESARELVESVRGSHSAVRWHEAGTYKRVQMYKGEPRAGQRHRVDDGRVQLLCGRTRVEATIEQVASFFDVSSTPKMKAFAATQDDVQDGAVLYTLVAPGPESGFLHQVTVKWMAVRMPSGLAKARDFVTLECQDSFTDPSGRRGWVRAYHSIKMPCCPELPGFVRGSLYHSGYVFVETETPGVLTCLSTLQVDLKGKLVLPRALYDVGVKRRIGALAHLQDKLHARRLSEQRLQSQPARADRVAGALPRGAWCTLCAAGFSLFTRGAECLACGAAVCHNCTELVAVAVSGSEVSVRVCVPCAARRRRGRGSRDDDADAKRKTRSARFLTDPGPALALQRPVGNHRASARMRRNTTLTSRDGDMRQPQQPEQHAYRHEKPFARLDSFISTSDTPKSVSARSRERHHSAKYDGMRLAQADLSREVPSPSSHGREQCTISFCDSLDGFLSATATSKHPVAEMEVEIDDDQGSEDQDAAASAVELYRGIVALKRAQRTALSASTRQRLVQELGFLYAKLDEAMRRYELEQ